MFTNLNFDGLYTSNFLDMMNIAIDHLGSFPKVIQALFSMLPDYVVWGVTMGVVFFTAGAFYNFIRK